MRDGGATWQLLLRALLVDMDPLLVAGRFRELVDSFLRDFDPVARADLGAEGGFNFVEVARMFVTWSDLHFGDGVGNDEFGVRYGNDLGDADIRRGFQQRRFTLGESDDSHVRHDQTHRPY